MVPGSTLMYGSSLRMETERPRALRIRPMLAAVMPFPSEEVTPPVTKTYFDIGRAPTPREKKNPSKGVGPRGGFFKCSQNRPSGKRGSAGEAPAAARVVRA